MSQLSRRGFIKALGIGAGALAGTRLAGRALVGEALAATSEPTSLVVVYLNGGINAIFTGADAFTGQSFGVTGNNVTNLGGGLVIDNVLGNAIPQNLRTKTASVGIRHGISDHGNAQRSLFMMGTASAPLMLADAIGGNGSIKAAVVGGNRLPNGQMPAPVNGTTLQPINDMRATIEAVAGSGANPPPQLVDREGAAVGITASQEMSKAVVAKHTGSLASVDQSFAPAIATLKKPVQPFNVNEFNTAYNLNGTAVNNFTSKMAAAELMVRSGANFVIAEDGGWDTHGDRDGNNVRNMMRGRIVPGLQTFLSRVVDQGMGERNVMVALIGDFHRSLPGSDHQANVAALMIGKTLKSGTTGKTDDRVGFGANTPSVAGWWQLVGAAAKMDNNPFGANPHGALLA